MRTSLTWSRSEKALLIVSVVVVLLGVTFIISLEHRNDLPNLSIPTPVMPSPNALDYFTKAGADVVDGNKISYAIGLYAPPTKPHPIPGVLIPPNMPGGYPGGYAKSDPDDHLYTQADKEALVRENAGVLKTLRQGFAYPYMNPPPRSFSVLFPDFAKERELARLLTLESQVKAGRGDWGGAVNSNLDAVQIGVMVPHGGTELAGLVGIACESIGRRPIWRTYDRLNAAQSRGAAQRLERLVSQQVPFAEEMQQEEWMGQAGLLEVLRRPDWARQIASIVYDTSGGVHERVLEAQIQLTPKRRFVDNYTRYMDQAIAVSRQPYGTPWPTVPSDPFSQALLPNFSRGRLTACDNRTQDALLMTTLALRSYKLEHGAYPASLNLLIPTYLKAVPSDPFAAGPLHYRTVGEKYVLYSVGPDGRDDGGKPVFDPLKSIFGSSDPRYYVNMESKGDIVAGLNIY